jgi:hypothetical protein
VDLAVGSPAPSAEQAAHIGLAAIIKTLGGDHEQLADPVEGVVR